MRLRTGIAILAALLAALLLSGLGLVASTAHVPPGHPRFRYFPLSNPLYEPPSIDGNAIAWTSQPTRCHPLAAPSVCTTPIYLHLTDLRRFHPQTIAQLPKGTSYVDLQLSNHYLVWQTRPYPTLSPGWQVWIRNLATGRQRLFASSRTEGGFMVPAYPALSLHGTTLEWIEHTCKDNCTKNGPSSVSLIDLSTGSHTLLAREDNRCTTLDDATVTERTAAWTRTSIAIPGCPASYTVHAFVLDRATGSILHRSFTPPPGKLAFEFAANQRYLAWTQETLHTNRDSRIMLMNLRTGTVTPVTSVGADNPLLSDDVLVWYGSYRGSIGALDLRTWSYVRLATTPRSQNTVFAAFFLSRPARTRVAWEESTTPATVVRFTYRLVVADLP